MNILCDKSLSGVDRKFAVWLGQKCPFQRLGQFQSFPRLHLLQIPLFPKKCWQVLCLGNVEKPPIRFTALELFGQRLAGRSVRFGHRAIVADEIDEECASQVEPTPLNQDTFAGTQVDLRQVECWSPRMAVPVGEEQEHAHAGDCPDRLGQGDLGSDDLSRLA